MRVGLCAKVASEFAISKVKDVRVYGEAACIAGEPARFLLEVPDAAQRSG